MSTGMGHYLRLERVGVYIAWCPGCKTSHRINVSSTDHPGGKKWHFNGNYVHPTFTPALRWEEGGVVCGYEIKDGWVHFDADCTHDHAGRAVMLPVFPLPNPWEKPCTST